MNVILREWTPLFVWIAFYAIIPAHQMAQASVEFSCETGLSCRYCHEDPEGGGTLTLKGERFRDAGYAFDEESRPPLWRPVLRLFVGFLHVLTAVMWFGTIFYVHLFIKPQSLSEGLPRSEVLLGRACILILGVTGVILSVWRIHSIETLWTTNFGIVLTAKVTLFLTMVVIAALSTTWLDRRMRQAKDESKGRFRANVVYEGEIYDVSESGLWKNGVHMRRHFAGADLTEALASAPHGPKVLERVPKLGPAPDRTTPETPPAARLFIFLSYLVLICAVAILFCVAYWNYGPPLLKGGS